MCYEHESRYLHIKLNTPATGTWGGGAVWLINSPRFTSNSVLFQELHLKEMHNDTHLWQNMYKLTPWSRVPLEKLIVAQLVKKSAPPPFMEPEISQDPAIGLYSEPEEFGPHLLKILL